MPEHVPPQPSLDDIINNTIADHSAELNVSALGKGIDFAAPDIDRYVSYGSETFGKLGYDPFRDNSTVYNDNTHWSADISRAYKGMWDLAGVGRSDTFAGGVFSEKDHEKKFMKTMNTYSSTRGGMAGFISNTQLSAGYTIGIIQAIAAEEALITLATWGLGTIPTAAVEGSVAVGRIARGIDLTFDAAKTAKGGINFMKNIQNSRLVKGFGQYGKHLNPLGESMQYLRNIDKMKDLNQYARSFTGAASLARDARKVHLTMSESDLEASIAHDEVRDKAYDDWYASHVGEEMDGETRESIEKDANDVFRITYNSNLGLIYATNALTFGTMFKGMRMTNKLFKMSEAGRFSVRTAKEIGSSIQKAEIKALKDNLITFAQKKLSQASWKSASKWALTSSVEGFQEINQDLISGFAKRYVTGDEKFKGSVYNSLLGGMEDMHAESFFSGLLMGTFSAPVSFSIEQSRNFVLNGNFEAIRNRESWKNKRQATYESRVKDAKILEDYFNNNKSWFDFSGRDLFLQVEAQEKMIEAAENGDRMGHEDSRAQVQRLGMKTVMKHGLEKEYIEHLNGLKEHTVAELNESMQRDDITEDNIGEFHAKIDKKIDSIKEFRKNYDEAQEQVNPINLRLLDPQDPQFDAKQLAYLKFELYRDELIFSRDAIYDIGVRLNEMDSILTKDGAITSTELKTLLDNEALASEITMLKADVSADKEYDTEPKEIAKKERRLNALKAYQKALIRFDNLDSNTAMDAVDSVHAEMFEAFNSLIDSNLNVESDVSQRVLNRKKFDTYWDYLIKTKERKSLQKHANMLLDPNTAVTYMDNTEKVLKNIEKNKGEYILKSLNAFHERSVGEEMMTELLEAGYFFNMEEVDDLIQRRIMPSKLYNVKTHKELTPKEVQAAQKIIAKHVKRLKGKHVLSTDTQYISRDKGEKDTRTAKGIIRQFASNKKDTPVLVSKFIDRLLASQHLTNTEREILNVIKDLGIAESKVILTDSAEAPITLNEDGTILIDVRFSAEDYKNAKTPFEYLAVSALLQAHYAGQLETNETLKANVVSLMNKAREAYIVKFEHQTSADIGLFTDPVQFLSEALNNEAFQRFLASVEDVEDPGTNSLWKTFTALLRKTFGKIFEKSLLNRAVKLSQLALTDEQIDITLSQDVVDEVAEVEAEKVKEEKAETEKVSTVREKLQEEVQTLRNEIKDLESKKGSARLNLKINNQLRKKRVELNEKLREIAALPKEVKVEVKEQPEHPIETKPEEVVDIEKGAVIKVNASFLSLGKHHAELQEKLASIYLNAIDYTVVPEEGTPETEAEPDAMFNARDSFENPITEDKVPQDSPINRLTAEDIVKIEGNMQTNPIYIRAIGEYNNKRLRSQEAPIEQEEVLDDAETISAIESLKKDLEFERGEFGDPELAKQIEQQIKDLEKSLEDVEEEVTPITDALISKTKTVDDLEVLLPGAKSVFNDTELETIVNRMNTRETIEDLQEHLESVQKAMDERLGEATIVATPVYHHTSVSTKDFDFGSFQRGKDQVSQFGDGLNASSDTTPFLVKAYGNPIKGEVNDSEFVEIDANKSEAELYNYLVSLGYKFNSPQRGSATKKGGEYIGNDPAQEYDDTDSANISPAIISLFNDFQQSNPKVKGVKVVNHIIGDEKVAPFYVIYESKSFYGPGTLSKSEVKEVEDESLDVAYTAEDLVEFVSDIEDLYVESQLKYILEELNAGNVTVDEIIEAAIERRVEEEQDNFDMIKKNWSNNLKLLYEFANNKKKFVANKIVLSLTPEGAILFKQQYPNAVKLSTEEFMATLSSYVLSTRAKAKTLRATLDLTNDENLVDNLIDLIAELKASRLLAPSVIGVINRYLTKIQSPYTLKNVVPKTAKGLAVAYSPVSKKVVLKKDVSETSDEKLSSFYMDNVTPQSMTHDEALFMIYDWLRSNKVHPDALPVREKRSYTRKDSEFKTFDGIYHAIFEEYFDAIEERGGANIIDEAFSQFNDLGSFRDYLVEGMETSQKEEENYDEEQYENEKLEAALAEYYGSRAFLISSGQYSGNIENLTPGERKIYNSTSQAYVEKQITPVEGEALAIVDELLAQKAEKSRKTYVEFVLNRINTENISTQELIAIHRIVITGKAKLTVKQSAKIMYALHSRISEGDIKDKTVRVGDDLLRITSDSTIDKIEFQNIETNEFSVYPIHEAMSMIDEVIEDYTEYQKQDGDTTITPEDNGILKQAYSKVFDNFTKSMDKVSTMEPEALKASIIEELNKCK